MPDHLHALIGIDGHDSLSQLIRDFKRITAKLSGVGWQRNFFDHRLREMSWGDWDGLNGVEIELRRVEIDRHGELLETIDDVAHTAEVIWLLHFTLTRELFAFRCDSDLGQYAALRAGFGIGAS